jgi:hypothetical protein
MDLGFDVMEIPNIERVAELGRILHDIGVPLGWEQMVV